MSGNSCRDTYRLDMKLRSVRRSVWLEAFDVVGDALVAAEKVRQRDDQRDAVLTAGHVEDAIQCTSLFRQFLVLLKAKALIVGVCSLASKQFIRCRENLRRDAFELRFFLEGHVQRSTVVVVEGEKSRTVMVMIGGKGYTVDALLFALLAVAIQTGRGREAREPANGRNGKWPDSRLRCTRNGRC